MSYVQKLMSPVKYFDPLNVYLIAPMAVDINLWVMVCWSSSKTRGAAIVSSLHWLMPSGWIGDGWTDG